MPNFLIYNLSDPVDLQRNIDLQKTFDLNDEHYIFYEYLLGVIGFLYPKAYWKKPEGNPTNWEEQEGKHPIWEGRQD